MNGTTRTQPGYEDLRVHVKIKLSALWTSVMFCYIYADYFGLYVPGALQSMLEGQMRPLGPTTQGVLVATSVMLTIPSAMILLSLTLKPAVARWLNIIVGALYTAIILITMWGWVFSIFYGVVEVTLTSLVIWSAWRWPRVAANP